MLFFSLSYSQSYIEGTGISNLRYKNNLDVPILKINNYIPSTSHDTSIYLNLSVNISQVDVVHQTALNHKIYNLDKDSTEQQDSPKARTFLKSNLFYFLGTAVAVFTVYLIFHRKDKPSSTSVTFGMPPSPK
jgi:hypothetical protein